MRRLASAESGGKDVNLDKYLDRMLESQGSTHCMPGDSMDVMPSESEVLCLALAESEAKDANLNKKKKKKT